MKTVSKSSVLRYAWVIARHDAAQACKPVRSMIGAAMRRAWAEANAAVVAAVTTAAQVAQQQQAQAAQMTWSVCEDFHAKAVIDHTVANGMPVLIHHGGRYPKLVDAKGITTDTAMHVSVWVGGTIDAMTGARIPGTEVPVHVHAHDGYNIRREVFRVVAMEQGEAISLAMARIGEATAAARSLRSEKAAWEAAVAPIQSMPSTLSRTDYEALCTEYGLTPMTDETVKHRQADVSWSRHSATVAIGEFLAARRGLALRRQAEAERESAEIRWAQSDADLVRRLKDRPVDRTVTEVLVGPVPEQHLRRNELWTVVSRGRDFPIDDDSPSIHGSHLLGHEGCMGREITFEVRTER